MNDENQVFAKGYSGQASFDGSFVTIHRKGFLARATVGKGDADLRDAGVLSEVEFAAQKRKILGS